MKAKFRSDQRRTEAGKVNRVHPGVIRSRQKGVLPVEAAGKNRNFRNSQVWTLAGLRTVRRHPDVAIIIVTVLPVDQKRLTVV